MESFQDILKRELRSPDHWDFASAGADTLDAYFKSFAEKQLLDAQG